MVNHLTIDRNTLASSNGAFCEDWARRNIHRMEWVGGTYDFVLQTESGEMIPGDVKSCETWYMRADRKGKKRAGLYTLESGQKQELTELNGVYLCIVHFGEIVVKSFFVRAVDVPDMRQVSWTRMEKLRRGC